MAEEYFEVQLHNSEMAPDRDTLAGLLREADGAITLLSDGIDAELLDSCPRLKIIANMAVGFENIDLRAAAERGVWVTNTPEVLTDATADIAMSLILAVTRRLLEADRLMRSRGYRGWDPRMLRGIGITGKTLGIIGFGRIGQAVARRARAFGMKIIYSDPEAKPEQAGETEAERVELEVLLQQSDVISLHTPYSAELHHLIDSDALGKMKKTAVFINTSRGKLMDERALCDALRSGRIAGAGLDVYENEPEFVRELASLDNVVLLPHIGSATYETRNAMAELAAKNLIAVLSGNKPLTPVNKPTGLKR